MLVSERTPKVTGCVVAVTDAEVAAPGGSHVAVTLSVPDAAGSVANVQATDAFVFGPKSLNVSEALRGVPLLPSSLEAIQTYSGMSTPYESGRSYVFVAVGDPDTIETKQFLGGGDGGPGSRVNTRFFHFLAFPTDPPVELYGIP